MKRYIFFFIALVTFMVANAQRIENGKYTNKHGVSYEFVGKDSLYVSDNQEGDGYTYVIVDSVLTLFDGWGQPQNIVIRSVSHDKIVLYFIEEHKSYTFIRKKEK